MRFKCERPRQNQAGLTLVEMLVVIAILGIVASIAIPKLFEAINKAKEAQGTADSNNIALSLEQYMAEKGAYPVPDSTKPVPEQARLVEQALVGTGLLKKADFKNAFGMGYLYGTTTNGDGYVLVDVRRTQPTTSPGSTGKVYVIKCNGTEYGFAASEQGLSVRNDMNIGAIQVCEAPEGMGFKSSFK